MPQIANGDSGAATRALINFVLPRSVAFTTTLPLDGNAVMAARVVAGPIAFAAPPAPATDARCYVRLTADGTNVPSFAGFVEHGSSAGYMNIAGVVNLVRFWFDGATSWVAIAQALNVVPLVMQAAQILSAAPGQIVVTFPVTLNAGTVPPASAFAITNSGGADTVSAVAISGQTVTLTKSRTTLSTDTVTLAYTQPGTSALVDNNGNQVGSSSITVANGVGGASQSLRLGSLSNMTETAHAGGGWDYAETASAGYGAAAGRGLCAKKIPANADGWVQFTAAGAMGASGPMLGLQTATTFANYTSIDFGFYLDGQLAILTNGAPSFGGNGAAFTIAAGSLLRLKRTAGTVTLEGSNDAGTSWTVMQTWGGSSTAALSIVGMIGSTDAAAKIAQLTGSANVA